MLFTFSNFEIFLYKHDFFYIISRENGIFMCSNFVCATLLRLRDVVRTCTLVGAEKCSSYDVVKSLVNLDISKIILLISVLWYFN